MDRMLLLLAALVLGCDVTDPNDTDTDTDDTDTTTELYEASFTATLNTYGWDGDEVVLLESEDKSADYLASNGEETVSGTTPDVLELAKGEWSASYYYDETPMLYLGWASANLSDTSDLGATLCADLSGDWSCDDGMHEDPIEIEDAVMNGCTIVFKDITTDSHPFMIDGNSVFFEGSSGSVINGIVLTDTIEMILDRSDGQTFPGTCTRI